MNRLPIQIGFWSALFCALAFLAFAVCFVAVIATSPLFFWTDLAEYLAYVQENGQFWPYLARLCMLIFAPTFVILLSAIHEYAVDEKKILTRIALSFGILFAATIGIHYFVQLTAVRLSKVNSPGWSRSSRQTRCRPFRPSTCWGSRSFWAWRRSFWFRSSQAAGQSVSFAMPFWSMEFAACLVL